MNMAIAKSKPTRNSLVCPNCIYGVDFSGAKYAGRKIWLAAGRVERRVLRIEECLRADALPGSAAHRDRCLRALRNFIVKQKGCAIGLDFPFGLPAKLVKQRSWEKFVRAFANRYPTAERFKQGCLDAAGSPELRRVTDTESQTPFSPYNLRLYRQTYFGIRYLLKPLVERRLASVLPMQDALPDRPWLLEVCPASTLKQEGLYLSYKGRNKEHRANRMQILRELERAGSLSVPVLSIRRAVLNDPDGDALDSVIAALATFRAVRNPATLAVRDNTPYKLEGYVYV